MSEPHTADLATRFRYREEGRELERERIIKLLEQMPQNDGAKSAGFGDLLERKAAIALIKGGKTNE